MQDIASPYTSKISIQFLIIHYPEQQLISRIAEKLRPESLQFFSILDLPERWSSTLKKLRQFIERELGTIDHDLIEIVTHDSSARLKHVLAANGR